MRLETEPLIIRDFVEADFDDVHAYANDPEVVRYMGFPLSTPDTTREHIARCIGWAAKQPLSAFVF